jgi:hypothetical protein
MTPNILENISTWLVDWSLLTIMDNTTPPRDPNDENDAGRCRGEMPTP